MKIASRFLTRPDSDRTVSFSVDGERITAQSNDSLAAALLAHSADAMRHSNKGSPRTAYCMMGVCFDCLVEVDGCPNTQACMITVREGMIVCRQQGLRKLAAPGCDGE